MVSMALQGKTKEQALEQEVSGKKVKNTNAVNSAMGLDEGISGSLVGLENQNCSGPVDEVDLQALGGVVSAKQLEGGKLAVIQNGDTSHTSVVHLGINQTKSDVVSGVEAQGAVKVVQSNPDVALYLEQLETLGERASPLVASQDDVGGSGQNQSVTESSSEEGGSSEDPNNHESLSQLTVEELVDRALSFKPTIRPNSSGLREVGHKYRGPVYKSKGKRYKFVEVTNEPFCPYTEFGKYYTGSWVDVSGSWVKQFVDLKSGCVFPSGCTPLPDLFSNLLSDALWHRAQEEDQRELEAALCQQQKEAGSEIQELPRSQVDSPGVCKDIILIKGLGHTYTREGRRSSMSMIQELRAARVERAKDLKRKAVIEEARLELEAEVRKENDQSAKFLLEEILRRHAEMSSSTSEGDSQSSEDSQYTESSVEIAPIAVMPPNIPGFGRF